ncbi:hypothetical protein [Arthrobacter rhombi]|uniref:hypothetical protein n=2 Tax=Arthrobacter rhombi TaxID=71253 RepID=UPI003FD593CF
MLGHHGSRVATPKQRTGAEGGQRRMIPDITVPARLKLLSSNQRLHRMAAADLTASWRTAGQIAARGRDPIQTPVRIVATFWKARNGRYDPNNLWPTVKAVVDGFVDAGLLADDDHKHVIGPDMRHGGKGEPRIVFTFEPATPAHEPQASAQRAAST